jgi:hypothetical protein
MIDNLMLAGMQRDEERNEQRTSRAAQAHELLVMEFFEGLCDPLARISTLGSEQDARPLVDVVLDLLNEEDDARSLLAGMLRVLRDHANTEAASTVLRTLATRFAHRQVVSLAEQGALDE